MTARSALLLLGSVLTASTAAAFTLQSSARVELVEEMGVVRSERVAVEGEALSYVVHGPADRAARVTLTTTGSTRPAHTGARVVSYQPNDHGVCRVAPDAQAVRCHLEIVYE